MTRLHALRRVIAALLSRKANVVVALVAVFVLHPAASFVSFVPARSREVVVACGPASSCCRARCTAPTADRSSSATPGAVVWADRCTTSTVFMFDSPTRDSKGRGTQIWSLNMGTSKIAQAEAALEREEAEAATAKVKNDQEWQFFDTARINVKGGDGGDGSVSVGLSVSPNR